MDLPDWVEVEKIYENDHVNEQDESRHRVVSINPYFQQHPEMVLGEQEIVSGPYGPQLVCKPYPDRDLKELLEQAVENLEAEITDYEAEELVEEEDHSIPADPSVANFSYTVYDGKIYYRENSRMKTGGTIRDSAEPCERHDCYPGLYQGADRLPDRRVSR